MCGGESLNKESKSTPPFPKRPCGRKKNCSNAESEKSGIIQIGVFLPCVDRKDNHIEQREGNG